MVDFSRGVDVVEDKKIVERGRFLIYSTTGSRRPPHTGAAVFALRTEFYRQRIHHLCAASPALLAEQLQFFDLEAPEEVSRKETYLVPVNVSYYPYVPGRTRWRIWLPI